MGACFRLRGECAAGQSHRLRLPETVILPRRYFAPQRRRKERGASNVRCLPALYAQRSHTEKRRLDGWHTEKATARLLCAKAAQRKGGEQRTLSTGTSCVKEPHRKAQARWMAHRKGYGKASLRKSGAQKRLSSATLFTGTSCAKGFDKRACYARTASA